MRPLIENVGLDMSMFSAVQFQTRELFRQTMNSLASWYTARGTPFYELIRKHCSGVVLLSLQLRYGEPVTFFDAAVMRREISMRLLRRNSRLDHVGRYFAGDQLIAEVRALWCVVRVEDPLTVAATPGSFPPVVVELFDDDERVPDESPKRTLPELLATIEASGPPLAAIETPFTLHRYRCEFADQWAFSELPCYFEQSREALAFANLHDKPVLRKLLSEPLRSLDLELSRPYYAFDRAHVETQAYEIDGGPVLVHRLRGDQPGEPLYGTIVERYQ